MEKLREAIVRSVRRLVMDFWGRMEGREEKKRLDRRFGEMLAWR